MTEKQLKEKLVDLIEKEKDSDREQVSKYWPLVEEYINQEIRESISRIIDRWNKKTD